jgi:hypothetical protein
MIQGETACLFSFKIEGNMAQGLLSLCLFFISVIGILLFRPDPFDSLTRYSEPARLEERKRVTLKMVELLEQNPEVVRQTLKMSNTSLGKPIDAISSTPSPYPGASESRAPSPFPFQGQTMEFKTQKEMNAWIYQKTKNAPLEFIDQISRTEMDPEDKLELLTTAGQSDDSESTTQALKEASILEAKRLISSPQGRDQQLTQKFLELYLEKESDPKVGKERVDEILNSNNTPPESP